MYKSYNVDNYFANNIVATQSNDDRIHTFCDYYLETYVMTNNLFPAHTWAEYSNSTTLTTNVCE